MQNDDERSVVRTLYSRYPAFVIASAGITKNWPGITHFHRACHPLVASAKPRPVCFGSERGRAGCAWGSAAGGERARMHGDDAHARARRAEVRAEQAREVALAAADVDDACRRPRGVVAAVVER